jgi:ketosteroid isomerase-like protein
VLDGREALAGYMRGFEEAFPGGRFAIDAVYTHHERSLARWRQLSADGDAVRSGISFAVHATDGRFLAVTGFFLDQPHAEEPL